MTHGLKISDLKKNIQLDAPDIGSLEKEYVSAAIESGYVSTFGSGVNDFEREFSAFIKTERGVAVQSGTAALHMALHVLGVSQGHEVILPSTTFAATLHAIMYVGATPVIVDVDEKTWGLSPEAFKAAITPRTKAVIPVHLYGNACAMDSILDIARQANIRVIEDATEALGSFFNGKHLGTFGDVGCFSFNGNKTITTGSGGMMVARSADILDEVVYLINQANPRESREGHTQVGFNYRMPNLNAALGRAQLLRLNDFLKKKKMFHQIYSTQLGESGICVMQDIYSGVESGWWFTAVLVKKNIDIQDLITTLKERGIPSRRIFKPLQMFPYAQGFKKGTCQNAEMLYNQGLCLPSSTLNTKEDIQYVCEVLKEVLTKG